jgi:hypothetical protein
MLMGVDLFAPKKMLLAQLNTSVEHAERAANAD